MLDPGFAVGSTATLIVAPSSLSDNKLIVYGASFGRLGQAPDGTKFVVVDIKITPSRANAEVQIYTAPANNNINTDSPSHLLIDDCFVTAGKQRVYRNLLIHISAGKNFNIEGIYFESGYEVELIYRGFAS